jgi:hypothetical protein
VRHPNSVHVRTYLKSAFPGWSLRDGERAPRDSYWFTVEKIQTRETHRALVARGFLDDVPSNQIETTLGAWRVAEEMRQAGGDFVLVSNSDARGRIPRNEL